MEEDSKFYVLHHNDLDGYAAASLVSMYEAREEDAIYIECSYKKDELDEFFNKVQAEDEVYIVDYSLSMEDMIKLLKITKRVTWIDHHKTAIDKYAECQSSIEEATGVAAIHGLRAVGLCGAALAYIHGETRYLKNDTLMHQMIHGLECDINLLKPYFEDAPHYLKLVNAWDVWENESTYWEQAKQLQVGIGKLTIDKLLGLHPENDMDEVYLGRYLVKGIHYLEYRKQWSDTFRDRYGFAKQLTLDGRNYDCYLMNIGNANSEYFGEEIDNHEICVTFCMKNDDVTISFYSNKDNVECGEIATNFGGGGHKGAAGCSMKLEEFIKNFY